MVNSKVYIKAAKLIANEGVRACCDAIIQASVEDYIPSYNAELTFMGVFQPDITCYRSYWWGFAMTEESQLARSLALLFMAEMTQDEIENS